MSAAIMARPGLIRDALGALPILALLAAVYLLPPDTSLREVRRTGALHVCMPPAGPPYVTGDPKAGEAYFQNLKVTGQGHPKSKDARASDYTRYMGYSIGGSY